MGKVIITHLVDGDPQGIRSVFISNKVCNMLVIPRANVQDAFDNPDIDLQTPAFYILLGSPSDIEVSKPEAYIGQTDNMRQRLKEHFKSKEKEFWQFALVFIAKDGSINKADVQYLEAKGIALATKARRYSMKPNKVKPVLPNLPPHQTVAAQEFFDDILFLTSFYGCDIFRITAKSPSKVEGAEVFYCGAKAIYTAREIVVLEGSEISEKSTPSLKDKGRRDKLVAQLTKRKNGHLILTLNKAFTSVSAAAKFVSGYSVNGWDAWKDKDGYSLNSLFRKS